MSEKYRVVNPTSLFTGRIGRKVDFGSATEFMLVFDGPRGDVFARFHPSEIKIEAKEAWALRLKDESKEDDMVGEYYFCDEAVDTDNPWLTDELQEATIFDDKENAIQDMKKHEENTFKEFGEGAICNYGYTNMMKNFEFVEVEIEEYPTLESEGLTMEDVFNPDNAIHPQQR